LEWINRSSNFHFFSQRASLAERGFVENSFSIFLEIIHWNSLSTEKLGFEEAFVVT